MTEAEWEEIRRQRRAAYGAPSPGEPQPTEDAEWEEHRRQRRLAYGSPSVGLPGLPGEGYVPQHLRAEEPTRTIRPAFLGQERRGVFGTAIDIVNRPMFAMANLFYGDPSAAGRAMIPFGGTIERATGLPTGLAEEERRTFADVLRAEGVGEMGKVDLPIIGEVTGRGALGLGLDIGLDPLTYLGPGLGRAGMRGLRAVARTRPVQALAKSRFVTFLGKAFVPFFRVTKRFKNMLVGKTLRQQALRQKGIEIAEGISKKYGDDVLIRARDIIEEPLGKMPAALWRSDPDAATKLYDEALEALLKDTTGDSIRAAVREVVEQENFLLDLYKERGIITEGMRRGHIGHLMTTDPKARRFWTQTVEGRKLLRGKSIAKTGAPETLLREYKAGVPFMDEVLKFGSIREMNDITMRKVGHVLLDADLTSILRREYGDAGKAVSAYDMLSAIRKLVADDDHPWVKNLDWVPAPKGRMVPSNLEDGFALVDDRLGVLRNVQIRAEEAKVLKDAVFHILDPLASKETANVLIRNYDRALSLWKRITLGLFPAYHARNLTSNCFNVILSGEIPLHQVPAAHVRAMKSLLGYRGSVQLTKGTPAAQFFRKTAVGVDDFLEEATKHGVLQGGFIAAETQRLGLADETMEISQGLLDAMRHPLQSAKRAGGKAVRIGAKTGRFVENSSRLALWEAALNNGKTFEEAAEVVNKFLFDWSATGYSKFEWETMRRIFPFYGWLRHNLPLQVEMLMRRPDVFAGLGKVKRFIEHDKPTPRHLAALPSWIKDRVALRVGTDAETGETRFWYWGNWLPAADLEELLRPQKAALENLSPFVTVPLELATNYDFFMDRKIQEYPGERDPFMFPLSKALYLPYWLEHPFKSIRLATTYHRLTRKMAEEGVAERMRKGWPLALKKDILGLSQYDVDLAKQAGFRLRELKGHMGQIKRDIRRAQNRREEHEVKRLRGLLDDVKEQIGALLK